MDFDSIMLSEVSETEKYIPYDFTHMWSIKTKTGRQQIGGYQRGRRVKGGRTGEGGQLYDGQWKLTLGGEHDAVIQTSLYNVTHLKLI